MHHNANIPVVLAASLTGLAGSFWRWPSRFSHHPQAAIYAGAFAGMCSSALIASWHELVAISVIGAIFYTLTRNLFEGVGGRLGTIAFAAVASVIMGRALF